MLNAGGTQGAEVEECPILSSILGIIHVPMVGKKAFKNENQTVFKI